MNHSIKKIYDRIIPLRGASIKALIGLIKPPALPEETDYAKESLQEILRIEQPFTYIDNTMIVKGKTDLLVKDKNGRTLLKDYIFYLPALFKALTGILDQHTLESIDRNRILCALGYLIVPNDLIPESIYGPAGYVDDVFVCCCVLFHCISKYGIDFVSPFWEMETDPVGAFVNATLAETQEELGDKAGEIMDYTGLGEIAGGAITGKPYGIDLTNG